MKMIIIRTKYYDNHLIIVIAVRTTILTNTTATMMVKVMAN